MIPAPGWTSDGFDHYINGARWGVQEFKELGMSQRANPQLQQQLQDDPRSQEDQRQFSWHKQ